MKYSRFAIVSILCLGAAPMMAPAAEPPRLESDSETATAGYYQLSWDGDTEGEFVLEESTSPSFEQAITLYRGPDTATMVSGRVDGTYYYRIRNVEHDEGWSDVTKVEVDHHPLSRAFIFFALGAIVFIATLTAVIAGNKRSKHNNHNNG